MEEALVKRIQGKRKEEVAAFGLNVLSGPNRKIYEDMYVHQKYTHLSGKQAGQILKRLEAAN